MNVFEIAHVLIIPHIFPFLACELSDITMGLVTLSCWKPTLFVILKDDPSTYQRCKLQSFHHLANVIVIWL